MNLSDQFQFKAGERKAAFVLMGIGALTLLIGILVAMGNHHWADKIWISILVNSVFFLGIALCGLFFIAANFIGFGGWYVAIKRIPEAMSMFIPYAGIGMLVILIGLWAHWHHLYHWAADGLTDPNSNYYDYIIAGKVAYLNKPFFTLRMIAYFALWIFFANQLRKISLKEDLGRSMEGYRKSKVYSAIFLIIFGITSSMMSWDFIMSIDSHWYSTLFGWYNFASLFVASIAVMILITIYLKSQGYLKQVTTEHLHDLGKFLFAFSVFWTYLWFSQFMLIWYANMGESTIYFRQRLDQYPFLFYSVLLINFLVPFFALLTRQSKRQQGTLATIAIILLFGHWLDYYLMIAPGASGGGVTFGFFELGMTLGFLGLFIYVVFRALTKARLVPVNHPFYKESIEHHT